jgi:hypothetical protein
MVLRRTAAPLPTMWRLSHVYCALSVVVALLAIITAQHRAQHPIKPDMSDQPPPVDPIVEPDAPSKAELNLDWSWLRETIVGMTLPEKPEKPPQNEEEPNKLPSWLGWLQPPPQKALSFSLVHHSQHNSRVNRVMQRAADLLQSFVDPVLLNPTTAGVLSLTEKVFASMPRLLACCR